MACISPVQIPSPKGNGKFIYVPCGRCAWCRRAKRNEWVIRFGIEMRDNIYTKFLTLTYDELHVPHDVDNTSGEIYETTDKHSIQKMIKRLRKKGYVFKYFFVSEKGPQSGRPHYHALIFSNDNMNQEVFESEWDKGFVTCYDADEGALRYVTKYILKGSDRSDNFMLCSKRPSIGSSFVTKDNALQTYNIDPETKESNFSFPSKGKLLPMPRYFKKKFSQFFDELSFEMDKVRTLTLMEERPKQFYLEKKYNNGNSVPLDEFSKFEETIKANYVKDLFTQYNINNKE